MAERKIEPDGCRALAALQQLARDIVDCRDMVGIHRMAQAEAVGEQRGSQQNGVIVEGGDRPRPARNIGGDQSGEERNNSRRDETFYHRLLSRFPDMQMHMLMARLAGMGMLFG